MSKDFRLWENNIRRALEQLRAISPDASVGAEQLSTAFGLVMLELYSAAFFTEFITSQAWRQAGLSEDVGNQLAKLSQQLDEFDEPDSDEAFAADHNWQAIQAQAAQVLTLLNRPLKPRKGNMGL